MTASLEPCSRAGEPRIGRDDRCTAPAITRLSVTCFRCYESAAVTLDRRPVVLTGPNGAGKTNLLEAVSLLAPGTGLRRARLAELGQQGADRPWAVSAVLDTDDGPVTIGTGSDPNGCARTRRVIRIDGAPASGQAALADRLALLWLTPAQDRLFVEAANHRRRFLDRLVYGLDPGHARRVAAYERNLRARARLLREARYDQAWLQAIEETMAADGVAVAAARNEAAARLNASVRAGVGPFPAADIRMVGPVEELLAAMPAVDTEMALAAALKEGRARDAETGGASHGPQRSDLAVTHTARGFPAAQCSTGEQKSLLIAILLAQARLIVMATGRPPILLLDEVAAHLDRSRRAWLAEELCALGTQAWLTGTDPALFDPFGDRAQYRHVFDGSVSLQGRQTC